MLAERLTEVVGSLSSVLEDAHKADAGNKAAARRVRVALQAAKKQLSEVRTVSFDVVKDSVEG